MKSLKKGQSFVKLEAAELEDINGGGAKDVARYVADFARGLFSPWYGCGAGDLTGKTAKPSQGCSSYPAKNSRCR